jgi:hypothetical protein
MAMTLFMSRSVIKNVHHLFIESMTMRGNEPENRNFLPLFFANKGLDAINLGNILHHKSVKAMVPPYFKDHSVPIEMVSIFSFCPFSGIVFHRVHQKFEFVFLIYGLWLTIFWTFKQGFYGDTHHL